MCIRDRLSPIACARQLCDRALEVIVLRLLNESPFDITEIDCVPGPFRCQIQLHHYALDFGVEFYDIRITKMPQFDVFAVQRGESNWVLSSKALIYLFCTALCWFY